MILANDRLLLPMSQHQKQKLPPKTVGRLFICAYSLDDHIVV